MTFTSADLGRISPFSVGTERSATVMLSSDFKWYFDVAKARLDEEKPVTVNSAIYDLLHGLLICHLFVTRDAGESSGEFQSESIAGYSYSRKGDIKAGSSAYEARYLSLIEKPLSGVGAIYGGEGQTRTDSVMPSEFALDDNDIDDSDDGVVNFDGEF